MKTARPKTLREKLTATAEGMRLWHQERSILETTERICELMDEQNVSRTELARRLGTTAGYVTQLLDGTRNMTLRKISDVFLVLNREFHPYDTAPSGDRASTPDAAKLIEGELLAKSNGSKRASSPKTKKRIAASHVVKRR